MKNENIILETENLCKFYFIPNKKKSIFHNQEPIILKALNSVNIKISEGEIYAVVGETGSGKTTLGNMVSRVFEPTSGKISLYGKDIAFKQGKNLIEVRKIIQMVFQDSGAALNPRQTVEYIMSVPLNICSSLGKKEKMFKIKKVLESVDLPIEILQCYPGVLSGGQKQRVNLARALIFNPKFMVLDEPTSALDVSVQAKILLLLMKLKKEMRLTYIFITHDMSVVKNVSNRVAIMYLGRIVEVGQTSDIFENPIHPYSKALLSAIPVMTKKEKSMLPKEIILNGEMTSLEDVSNTCPFISRCQEKKDICKKVECPKLKEVNNGHFVRCILY